MTDPEIDQEQFFQDVVDLHGPHIAVLTMVNTFLYRAGSDRDQQRALNTLVESYLRSLEDRYEFSRERIVEAVHDQFEEYALATSSQILSDIMGQEIFLANDELLEKTDCDSIDEFAQKIEDGEINIQIT